MDRQEFFISYNENDIKWARIIAKILDEHQHSYYFQERDSPYGENFTDWMLNSIANSNNFIAVYSEKYTKSVYCKLEYAEAIKLHRDGQIRKFLIIRIEDIEINMAEGFINRLDIFKIPLFQFDLFQFEKKLLQAIGDSSHPAVYKQPLSDYLISLLKCLVIPVLLTLGICFTCWMYSLWPDIRQYRVAASLEKTGQLQEAAIAFGSIDKYRDAQKRSFNLWKISRPQETLSAGYYHTAAIRTDGTVRVVGGIGYQENDVGGWTDILSISAGNCSTIALREDGQLLTAGSLETERLNIGDWKNVVAIASGKLHTVALLSDGTVKAVGNNSNGQCDVNNWKKIIAVSAGDFHTVGLRIDGSVEIAGNIVAGPQDASRWRDIINISCGAAHTVGLRTNGTVIAEGECKDGRCDTENWSDIKAIAAGRAHTVGLRTNGTVIACGNNEKGQCDTNTELWTDIVAISAGALHTVGLRSDGTVVATGSNNFKQCETGNLADIRIPDMFTLISFVGNDLLED